MTVKTLILVTDDELYNETRKICPTLDTIPLYNATAITSGYNQLAAQNPADIYCFMHQDCQLYFDIQTIIPAYFALLDNPGVLGFCGTAKQVSNKFWYDCENKFGALSWGKDYDHKLNLRFNEPQLTLNGGLKAQQVETLDGYCLFIQRHVFESIKGFDDDYLWHCYDMDICLRALAKGYKNYVIMQPSHHIGSNHDELAKRQALTLFSKKWQNFMSAKNRLTMSTNRPNPLKIWINTIAKNEIDHVERFMHFCADADGVVVVDTGSNDGTPEKLTELGATVKVVKFDPWSTLEEYRKIEAHGGNPFRYDLPRNLALDMVPHDADVCISIDLDEVLVPKWRSIIESIWEKGVTTHLDYQFAWQMTDPAPTNPHELYHNLTLGIRSNVEFHYNKIHQRYGYLWQSPIHEKIVTKADFTNEVWASYPGVLVCHYQKYKADRANYLPLLELAVSEDPDDIHSLFYYARELGYRNEHLKAMAAYQRFLAHPKAGEWAPERSSACSHIAIANYQLATRPQSSPAERDHHKREVYKWAMRACSEQPGQREGWVELAARCYDLGDLAGCYWAAKQALTIDPRDNIKSYTGNKECWGHKPHFYISIAAFWMARPQAGPVLEQEALQECWNALVKNPWDGLLIDNMSTTQQILAKPYQTADPLIDVIILAYSKTSKEYEMTRRCIRSLRCSSPDISLNIIVVETNPNLAREPFATVPLFEPDIKLVQPNKPFGYNDFLNEGYTQRSPTSKHILLLNNDVIVFCQDFLKKMLQGLNTVQSVSAYGLRESTWGRLNDKDSLIVDFDVNSALVGWCILFNKAILHTIPFQNLFPREIAWYGQDNYYGAQLAHYGYKHALVTAAKALHLQMQSHYLLDQDIKPPGTRQQLLQKIGLAGKSCVEVGVFRGEFAQQILAENPSELILVDPWAHQDETIYHDECNLTNDEFEKCYQKIRDTLGKDPRVTIDRDFSTNSAVTKPNNSYDFIYIDAIHTETQCLADIEAWWPKVKKGGWLCGHDFQAPAVAAAVHKFLQQHPQYKISILVPEVASSWAIQKHEHN
jgi:GT2 family glycosyltransferase/glycosyltransferase involved in cell wall biosynthesis